MISAFGRALNDHLQRAGLSQRAFGELVGMSHANVNKIINSTHEAPPPPLDADLSVWMDVLKVPEAERQTLVDLAALAQIPGNLREKFERIYFEHPALKAQIDGLERAVTAYERAAGIESAR